MMANRLRRGPVPLYLALVLATQVLGGCQDCAGLRRGITPMCGVCKGSGDCRAGLYCVNGTCETTPPSCHVKIGL